MEGNRRKGNEKLQRRAEGIADSSPIEGLNTLRGRGGGQPYLEWQDVGELVEEHLELPGADDKARRAELIGNVPSQGTEFESLLKEIE